MEADASRDAGAEEEEVADDDGEEREARVLRHQDHVEEASASVAPRSSAASVVRLPAPGDALGSVPSSSSGPVPPATPGLGDIRTESPFVELLEHAVRVMPAIQDDGSASNLHPGVHHGLVRGPERLGDRTLVSQVRRVHLSRNLDPAFDVPRVLDPAGHRSPPVLRSRGPRVGIGPDLPLLVRRLPAAPLAGHGDHPLDAPRGGPSPAGSFSTVTASSDPASPGSGRTRGTASTTSSRHIARRSLAPTRVPRSSPPSTSGSTPRAERRAGRRRR